MRIFVAFAIAITTLSSSASAQPLVDRVPADAMVYIGWAGSSNLGADYDQTHLKALIDASGFEAWMQRSLIEALPADEVEPELREVMKVINEVRDEMFKHPTAIYLTGVRPEAGPNDIPVDVAIICEAGDQAAVIAQRLQRLQAEARNNGATFAAEAADGLLILRLGQPTAPIPAGLVNASLRSNPRFAASMTRTDRRDPIVNLFVDFTGIWRTIDQLVEAEGPADARREWPKIKQVLGLEGMESLMIAGDFDGADWAMSTFLAAPAPRKGVASLIETAPLGDAAFKLVPQTAAVAGVSSYDLAAAFDSIREMVGQYDPNAQQQLDQIVQQFQDQLGVHVRDDLFAALGTEWAFYTDRNVGGTGWMGMVLVNPLRDAAKAERALSQLFMIGSALLAERMQQEDFRIAIKPTRSEDVSMYHLTTPLISPTFAFADGKMYVSLLPHTVVGAINYDRAGRKTLADNPRFTAMRDKAAGGKVTGFGYIDIEQNLGRSYPMMAMFDRLSGGFYEMLGADGPVMVLPPLDVMQAHAAPVGRFQWVDTHGLHIRSHSPFPGAAMVGMGQEVNLSVASTAVGLGIMLPALGRAREIANRSVSGANLNGLYKAMYTWSVTNNDQFPESMAVLVEDGSIGTKTLFHPASGKEVPDEVQTKSMREGNLKAMAEWAAKNSDYVYITGLTANVRADHIVMYEKTGNDWTEEGMNILFGDGHVEWQSKDQARRTFRELDMTDPYARGH